MTKCFKCEKELKCAVMGGDVWNAPIGAVCLEGGYNFGSAIYDALMDGMTVEIMVCDDCLKAAGDDRKKEHKRDVKSSLRHPRWEENYAKKTHQSGEHHTSE